MKMKKIASVGSDQSKINAYISALNENVKVYSHDITDNGEHNVEDKLDDYIDDSSKELFERSSVDTVLVSNPINAYVMAIQAREEGSIGDAALDHYEMIMQQSILSCDDILFAGGDEYKKVLDEYGIQYTTL